MGDMDKLWNWVTNLCGACQLDLQWHVVGVGPRSAPFPVKAEGWAHPEVKPHARLEKTWALKDCCLCWLQCECFSCISLCSFVISSSQVQLLWSNFSTSSTCKPRNICPLFEQVLLLFLVTIQAEFWHNVSSNPIPSFLCCYCVVWGLIPWDLL